MNYEQSPNPDTLILGWREWVQLPQLLAKLPIKAKLDTGARTSVLHAAWLTPFETAAGEPWVRFGVHRSRRRKRVIECEAPIIDRRTVTDSGGHREKRYVIETQLQLGSHARQIEITLTNRDTMMFPMLLGRTALRNIAAVNPAASYTLGRPGRKRPTPGEP